MTRKSLAITIASSLLLLGNAWAQDGVDDVMTALEPNDLAVVQQGEEVYRTHCAACHGESLEGQTDWRKRDAEGYLPAPPHDATGHTWHHADDQLFEITKYGPSKVIGDPDYKTRMPAYQGILSDDDIIAVLSYIKNSWPADERDWQEQVNGNDHKGMSADSDDSGFLKKLFGK